MARLPILRTPAHEWKIARLSANIVAKARRANEAGTLPLQLALHLMLRLAKRRN